MGRNVVRRTVAVVGVALTLQSCAAMRRHEQRDEAQQTEPLLAAAGFRRKPADTPERAESLRSLPPVQLTTCPREDRVMYVYADPVVCNCLWVGDEAQYAEYQRLALKLRIAEERRRAAEMNASAALDWGPWGPLGW